MTDSKNSTDSLDNCGCCSGPRDLTPASVENRPGLSALAYRVGTHGQFKASMQYRLSRQDGLEALTVRDDDDFSMALLDAWSVTADVLSFYQERIANEGFLRTATERLSLLNLARLIGYELNPGVAAGTYLSFTIEDTTVTASSNTMISGKPEPVTIESGTRVQSIPGQDELPQTFETIEEIEARIEWNEMKPVSSQYKAPETGMSTFYLKGTSTNLNPGDAILFIIEPEEGSPAEFWDLCKVKTVEPDYDYEHTKITLDTPLESDYTSGEAKIYALRQRASLFGYNAPDWTAMAQDIKDAYKEADQPQFLKIPGGTMFAPWGTVGDWPGFDIESISDSTDAIILDAVYPEIFIDSWVVLSGSSNVEVHRVTSVEETSYTDFTLSSKVTRVEFEDEISVSHFSIRETTVFAQSEELELAGEPIESVGETDTLLLDREIEGLPGGRLMILTGELYGEDSEDDEEAETAGELLELLEAAEEDGLTRLTFGEALENTYKCGTVTINANVALATHGETVTEVLGSGDASRVFQQFTLRQPPLTHVSASTAGGTSSTLEVRVNDVLWEEVSSLYGHGPEERIYTTRMDDDGNTYVRFGDGITGCRVPTGKENITAVYRKGIGLDGLLDTGQLSLLMTRPYGVKEAVNPFDASGAADPETLDQARENSPLTVLTLDRVVSLRDFEDFARAFAGIEKARADWVWDGETRLVYLTVAGSAGEAVDKDSTLYRNLGDAVKGAGNGCQSFRIESYTPLTFDAAAKIQIDSAYITEDVIAEIETTLTDEYSFEQRRLARPVTASEVIALIQGVEGVEAVDLDALYFTGGENLLNSYLPARKARWDAANNRHAPAQLLTINTDGITLTEMSQ